MTTAVLAAPEWGNSEQRSLRNRRNTAFNDKTGTKPPLDKPLPENKGYGSSRPYYVRIAPLPFTESHTVIVARITGFQPYFASVKTSIYTQLQATVEKVIKAQKALTIGQVVSVPQLGGMLRLTDARVVKQFAVPNETTLDIGRRYLLFLRYTPETDDYRVVKAWELRDGRAQPLSATDIRDAQNGISRYAGMSESDFLQAVEVCRDLTAECK